MKPSNDPGMAVTSRRLSSRNVALTAAFLALAAGAAAACDSTTDENNEQNSSYTSSGGEANAGTSGGGGYNADASRDSGSTSNYVAPPADNSADSTGSDDSSDTADEVFYCADSFGVVADEDDCNDSQGNSAYYLWHSPSYDRGLPIGSTLEGGDYIAAGDRGSRTALHLPATGRVANGTIKTNVVGRGSIGSSSVHSAGG